MKASVAFGLLSATAFGTMAPTSAQAQDYNCQNEAVYIDIKAQPLESGLDELSEQTSCPISREDDELLRGLRANAVRGRMTPVQALAKLVYNQGLMAKQVRQGLAIDWYQAPADRRDRDTGAPSDNPQDDYPCNYAPTPISIRAQDLPGALTALTNVTGCPISPNIDVSGYRSVAVNGTMTPLQALRRMVGPRLSAAEIKGGYAVNRARRR